jgi:hypothetical protein
MKQTIAEEVGAGEGRGLTRQAKSGFLCARYENPLLVYRAPYFRCAGHLASGVRGVLHEQDWADGGLTRQAFVPGMEPTSGVQ